MSLKIGQGYDIHRLVEGRKLIIGGVSIPGEKGLLGHSDADVLTHAIIDALLGASGLGDIGKLFPDSDQKFKDINSLKLLAHVKTLLNEKNIKITNIDSTVIIEKPKLGYYREKMIDNLSKTLEINTSQINIKFKTNEKVGEIGKGEAVSAYAITLLDVA